MKHDSCSPNSVPPPFVTLVPSNNLQSSSILSMNHIDLCWIDVESIPCRCASTLYKGLYTMTSLLLQDNPLPPQSEAGEASRKCSGSAASDFSWLARTSLVVLHSSRV